MFVEGRLQSREWETQDKQKRSTIEVIVENFQFLERAASAEPQAERAGDHEGEREEELSDGAETSEG